MSRFGSLNMLIISVIGYTKVSGKNNPSKDFGQENRSPVGKR